MIHARPTHGAKPGAASPHPAHAVLAVPEVRAPLAPFLVAFGVALAAVVTLNLTMDPSGLRDAAGTHELVAQHREGQLILADDLGYQRAWVAARLTDRATCPETLILGSSTMGALSHEMFAGRRFLNGWMGGPTIEDFEAITMVLRRAPCVPATIVLGVDPWWGGNPEFDDQRWQASVADALAYQREASPVGFAFQTVTLEWERLEDLLNFTTTRESTRLLAARSRATQAGAPPPARVVAMTEVEACARIEAMGLRHVRSFDGHYTQCDVFRRPPEEVRQLAAQWLSSNMHDMAEWRSLDEGRLDRLAAVLDAWRARGSALVLVGPPYHPETFRRLTGDPVVSIQLRRLDAALGAMADARAATFLDLRGPERHGCPAEAFEDADHGRPECMARVAAAIREAAGLR